MVISVIISKYEAILTRDVRLAFFIPIIVYMSDAVGTQTETVYVRGLVRKHGRFTVYLFKELVIGLGFGGLFGAILGLFSGVWLQDAAIGWTVGGWLRTRGTGFRSLLEDVIKRDQARETAHRNALDNTKSSALWFGPTNWKAKRVKQWENVRKTRVPF